MIDRRSLIAGAAALAAAPAFAGQRRRRTGARPIGIQLYTLRELFQKDPAATLTTLARIGYREIEYGGGGYDQMDAAMLRRTADRLGLKAPSAHIAYEALSADFAGSVRRAKTLGIDTVVIPYLVDPLRNEAAFAKVVADMNAWVPRLRDEGLALAYHNHDFEFTVKPGGVSLYDRLIRDGDPSIQFELDLYWIVRAGEDAAALIRRLAGRIYAYHVKDAAPSGAMTSVGAGTIDFAGLFRLNAMSGVKHFYVENDMSPAPYIPDITTSFNNLTRLLGR